MWWKPLIFPRFSTIAELTIAVARTSQATNINAVRAAVKTLIIISKDPHAVAAVSSKIML